MRQKAKPTNHERMLAEDDLIVSKTDRKGIITYANRTFIKFALLEENELLGAPHNIIRHPDMPKAVFRLLWDTIEKGNEIFAYVKNISSDGAYYWVFANITPVYDQSRNIIGYYSFRRRPSREAIKKITPVYQEMLRIEQNTGGKTGIEQSVGYLTNLLTENGTTYEQFILSI
ncbi:MAG: PAS domain-containing protein [Ignavibacteriales bacterium]|nr:PAS domain-containing protein [Ignavibacteriales bacterium]